MKIVLITGLDGSGKSTILSKIRQSKSHKKAGIILLPHIESDALKSDTSLFKASVFINSISQQADVEKIPQLKAVALLGSMLLFNEILKTKTAEIVFCERHPLIDTGIYAQFYAGKLGPGSIKQNIIQKIDVQFNDELKYLLKFLPNNIRYSTDGLLTRFLEFIYHHFYIQKNTGINDLKKVFHLDLPDKIHFLKADPRILSDRIKNREVHEAHESLETLTMLNGAYEQLIKNLTKIKPGLVEIIDTNLPDKLDDFYNNMIKLIN